MGIYARGFTQKSEKVIYLYTRSSLILLLLPIVVGGRLRGRPFAPSTFESNSVLSYGRVSLNFAGAFLDPCSTFFHLPRLEILSSLPVLSFAPQPFMDL